MSNEELKDWNPMEEDFSCPKFNSYHTMDFDQALNELCLFVKNIPADLTRDAFIRIMQSDGRKATKVFLSSKPHPKHVTTFGFVHFATPQDARYTLNSLHGRPPLHLDITYAKKQQDNANESKSFHNGHVQNDNSRVIVPVEQGRGRGLLPNSVKSLKIISGGDGRKVTLISKEKTENQVDSMPKPTPHRHENLASTDQKYHIEKNRHSHKSDGNRERSFCDVNKQNPNHLESTVNNEMTRGGDGQKVTVVSNEKTDSKVNFIQKSTSLRHENHLSANQKHHIEKDRHPSNSSVSREQSFCDVNNQNLNYSQWASNRNSSIPEKPELIPNLYRQCLYCKEEAFFSCANCKKPYCSQKCQVQDWLKHKNICHQLSKTNDADRKKNRQSRPQDSSYVSEASSSEHETEANSSHQIDVLSLSSSKKELVKICHLADPSKFWIHRKETLQALLKLEREMNAINDKITVSPIIGMVCCVQENTKFFRVKILEVSNKETVVVYYLDYGRTSTVSLHNIIKLPLKFFLYPAQAICCKLVDNAELENVTWSSEDTASFKVHTETKYYTAHVLRYNDDVYEVSLLNEDGLSLFSILMAERNAVSCIASDNDLDTNNNQLASVVFDVKIGSKISIVPLSYNSNKFFAYLLINEEDDLANIRKVVSLLTKLETKDATMSIEEMDYAAGYSLQYNDWFRCVVLQRKQMKFLVRFIDFGNEEEIEKVRLLTPELLGIKSYLVICDKPECMSMKEVEEYFEEVKESKMTVRNIHNNSVQLCFSHKSSTQSIQCYPWFRGIKSFESVFKLSKIGNIDSKKVENVTKVMLQKQPEIIEGKKIDSKTYTNKIMAQKSLQIKHKYKIKVTFINTLSELFVQLVDDENSYNTFHAKLNTYCRSINNKFVPNSNELICCKYSADGEWYRGHILEENSDSFNVFFIDFGNKESVPKNDVRFLPEEFRCPKFSICVSLLLKISKENMQNVVEKLFQNDWEMEVIGETEKSYKVGFFQGSRSLESLLEKDVKIVENNAQKVEKLPTKAIIQVFVCYKENQKVFIQKIDDAEKISYLTNTLCTTNMPQLNKKPNRGNIYAALFDDGLWYRVRVIQESDNDSYEVYFIDFGNSKTVSINDMRELPSSLLEMPPFCRPVLAQNMNVSSINLDMPYSVQVVKEINGLQEVKFLDINGKESGTSEAAISNSCVTAKDEAKKTALMKFSSLQKQLLPTESSSEISISHTENNMFYVQKLSDESQLAKLREMLKNADNFKCLSDMPDVGDVILAKFSLDNEWYRGCVKKVEHEDVCKVLFFDYGNSEPVMLKNMRIPSKECYNFPVFSIPVKFQDLKVVEESLANNELTFSVIVIEKQEGIYVVDIKAPSISCIKTRSLKATQVEIKFSHMEGSVAYIQQVSDLDDLQKVMVDLQNSEIKKPKHLPKVGELFRVKYGDGLWYRGLIKSNAAESYKVFFVDYGNTDEIKLEDICLLPEEDASYAMCSIPVIVQNLEDISKDIDLEKVFTAVLSDQKIDNVQVVKIYPLHEPVLESALHLTTLPIEKMCEVIILHFDEKYYFARRISDGVKVKEMSDLLKNAQHQMIYHTPKINEVLLVRRKDELLYRCVIRNINDKQDRYTVFCFDSGVTEEASKSDIFYLPKQCCTFPVFTVKILSNEVETVNLGQRYCIEAINKTSDSAYIVKIFRPITLKSLKREKLPLHTKCSVSVCHMEQDIVFLQNLETQKLIVELQEELIKCSVAKSISRKPVVGELVCAKCSIDNSWYRGCVEEILPNDAYKILFIDYGNTEEVNKQNIQCLPTNLASYPSFCIPVRLLNEDILKKPLQCDQVYSVIAETEPHEGVQNVNFVIETENIPQGENLSKDHSLPAAEAKPKFLYSNCKHIPFSSGEQDIVIYFVDDEYLFCAPYDTENISMNMNLIKLMTEYCEKLPVSTYDGSYLPEENEMVLAKYSEDGQWYRGAVIERKEAPHYIVNFVDFGNTEILHQDSLRKMPKQFMSLELQAHLCQLTGFKVSEENLPRVTEELKQFTLFNMPEPLKAVVNVGELITINVLRITNHLLAKNLIISET